MLDVESCFASAVRLLKESEKWKGVVGVVLPSLIVIKKVVDEKHKAVLPTQGQCHSSNRKHSQCVLVALTLKHTLAIISDVVA